MLLRLAEPTSILQVKLYYPQRIIAKSHLVQPKTSPNTFNCVMGLMPKLSVQNSGVHVFLRILHQPHVCIVHCVSYHWLGHNQCHESCMQTRKALTTFSKNQETFHMGGEAKAYCLPNGLSTIW